MKKIIIASFLATLSARYATADVTTLYIPGFDPQAVTADIEGVDASGHTTWRIGPGVPSGTFTEDGGMVFASATLVEGPTDAHFVEADPMISVALTEDCGISGGIAVCTMAGHIQGETTTDTETETASGFAVQFGGVPATLTATSTNAGPTVTVTDGTGGAGAATISAGGSSGGSVSGSGTLPTVTEGQSTSNGSGTSPTSPTSTGQAANDALGDLQTGIGASVLSLAALVLSLVI
ncbi:hypothetical protein BN946_scf184836.g60 [Trametes cinnabarina]|uniref:Uncharacterized protein n=1 Tax=Pycnoporus cinnabarinus TaxID=5643 RepID=A0A060S6Z1_PYCCI|nr:hypothetical protein BN946_scf184836.g60 [Trametes cinnabarina]